MSDVLPDSVGTQKNVQRAFLHDEIDAGNVKLIADLASDISQFQQTVSPPKRDAASFTASVGAIKGVRGIFRLHPL